MILRRLSQSLKVQNWTAIWIEFVLLVAGVFLGIQVSNWNAERETRQKSAIFSARLMADMDAWGYSFRLGSARAWFENDAEDARRSLREFAPGLLERFGG